MALGLGIWVNALPLRMIVLTLYNEHIHLYGAYPLNFRLPYSICGLPPSLLLQLKKGERKKEHITLEIHTALGMCG